MVTAISLNTVDISLGFGHHLLSINPNVLSTMAWHSQWTGTTSLLAGVLAKTSFAITMLHISDGWTRSVILIVTVIMNLAVVVNVFVIWFRCLPPSKVWDFTAPGVCLDQRVNSGYAMFAASELLRTVVRFGGA